MLDLDLDQRLRDEFRSTADRVEASARLDGLVRDRLARRQTQRRVTLGGGAALGLALIVGITAALAGSNGPSSVTMSPTDADRDGRGSVNADAGVDANLDTDGGVTADADVTAPITVPPGTDGPTSLLPPPEGVPAVPGAETVTGSFAGALNKVPSALPGPGCHVEASFDPVLTLADGKTWNVHATYCVAGVGGVGGTSEFAVDMPNGDTMTGELDLAATGSGLGLFTITGGSGAYAQANGYCQLDGWAIDLTTLGTIQKHGSFSCSIAGVASQ